MRCRNIRDSLSAYIDGELTAKESKTVEAHLSSCASCRHDLEEIQGLVLFVASLAEEPLPRDFAKEFIAPKREKAAKPWYFTRTKLALAAGLFLVIVGVSAVFGGEIFRPAAPEVGSTFMATEAGDSAETEAAPENDDVDEAKDGAAEQKDAGGVDDAATRNIPSTAIVDEQGTVAMPQGGDCYAIALTKEEQSAVVAYLEGQVTLNEYRETQEGDAAGISFYLTVEDAVKLGNNLKEMGILNRGNGALILAANNESYQAMAAEASVSESGEDTFGIAEQNEREAKLRQLMEMVKVEIRFH